MKKLPSFYSGSRAFVMLSLVLLGGAYAGGAAANAARGEDGDAPAPVARKRHGTEKQPENVQRYMARIFDAKKFEHSCNATTPAEFAAWQTEARAALAGLLRIP